MSELEENEISSAINGALISGAALENEW